MKSLRIFSILLCSSISVFSQTNSSFHDFEVRTILGDTISLSQFAGKKVMVVNTASFCSYTYQYGLLESLREQYSTAYNFEILGFPCNDFGNQEPGHDSTILEFCTNTYNVQFPMMSAIHIRTGDTAAVYKWLQREELNGVSDAIVDWNFNKFLIDEEGNWVDHFTSTVSPFDTAIVNWITSGSTSTNTESLPSKLLRIFSTTEQSINILYHGLPTRANISLYALDGRLIQSQSLNLVNGYQLASFGGMNIPNGIYLTKIELNNKLNYNQIVLINSN
jgi:glutathione peroxidase